MRGRVRTALWLVSLVATGLFAISLPAQQPAAPGDRPAFERILWLHGSPDRDAAFWDAVAAIGFSAVSVTGGEDPKEPARHGLRFYRDQCAGKGVLELRAEQFDPLRDRYEDERDPRLLSRPGCLADAEVIDGMLARLRGNLRAALPEGPLAVSLADEASSTRHINPLDLCASPGFVAGFRDWLRERYAIGELNEVWGTAYASFDAIRAWTADQIRARELQGASLPGNLAPWNDQLAYTDQLFAAAVHRAREAVTAIDPDMPCGLTGMQAPSAYGGHDYSLLMPEMSFFEAYPGGAGRELAASLAQPGSLQFATLFPLADGEPMRLIDARLAGFVAHGMAGVIAWSSGDLLGEGAAPTPLGRQWTAAMKRLGPAAEAFGRARIERASVWLVESQPSVRAHWMIDSMGDGDTWIRRLSSYEARHSTSMAARRSWLLLLQDLGLQPSFVPAEDLTTQLAEGGPKLLVLPATLSLSDAQIEAILRFVARGGHLVADHGAAFYDGSLRLRPEPGLDRLFELRGRRLDWSANRVREGAATRAPRLPGTGLAVAEPGLRGRVGEDCGEEIGQVQIESRYERGRAVYLNLAVCEYASLRLDPEQVPAARDLRSRLRVLLDEAGVQPPVMVAGEGLPTLVERVLLRAPDGRRLLAIRLNALDDPVLMQELGERGPRPIEILMAEPVRLRDLSTGEELGSGRRIRAELDPWTGLFVEFLELPK